jgi:hypothetical protein
MQKVHVPRHLPDRGRSRPVTRRDAKRNMPLAPGLRNRIAAAGRRQAIASGPVFEAPGPRPRTADQAQLAPALTLGLSIR